MSSKARKQSSKKGGAGPVAFFVSLFIVALGTIQLASTFHTYALNLAELNGLKKQEAALVAQKREFENDIARWNDKAYVTAQARDRLGFVFPGEQAIRVEHPEAVTGKEESDKGTSYEESTKTVLPWYKELEYSFKQADQSDPVKTGKTAKTTQDNGKKDQQNGQNDQQQADTGRQSGDQQQ